MFVRLARFAAPAVLALSIGTPHAALAKPQAVPAVKCPFQTMTGTEAVTAPRSVSADVPAALAGHVSYYTVGVVGVFAPRGWHCIGHGGSEGVTLIVVPGAVPSGDLDREIGVEAKLAEGQTSGRFVVFEKGGPLFPQLRVLAPSWQKDDPLLQGVPTAPIRGESVTHVSKTISRFCDPPKLHGVGDGSGGAYQTCGIATTLGAIPPSVGSGALPDLRLISITTPDRATLSALVSLNASR